MYTVLGFTSNYCVDTEQIQVFINTPIVSSYLGDCYLELTFDLDTTFFEGSPSLPVQIFIKHYM